jgi:arylsulfatase A
VSALICLLIGVDQSLRAAIGSPPNILLVVADDLGYGDLGCFDHPEIKTPNLDQLAAEGLKLTRCYAAAAVCSPARAGLLTGRTPYRVGVYNAIPFMSPAHLRSSEITIATLLRNAGYTTALTGKWHLNGMFNLPGQPQPNDHGFDHSFSVQNNALPNHANPYNFVRNGIPAGVIAGYSAGIVANEAINWLSTQRDKTKPFFLYVAFNEPHEPIATEPRFKALYEKKHPDDPSRIAYYGNVSQMDDALGRILRALEAQGLNENTLVWFTSDNGPARTKWHNAGSSGGLREFKGHMYEGGLRVPGIVRWPKHIRPGTSSAQPVSGVDFLPTVCDITGVPGPNDRSLDGASIAPLFSGRPMRRTTPLYWQYIFAPSKPQIALLQEPWKLLAWLDGPRPKPRDLANEQAHLLKNARLDGFELYNVQDDPSEKNDLSAAQPEKLAELKGILTKFHAQVRTEGPIWPAFDDPAYEQRVIQWPNYLAKPLPRTK